MGNKSSSMLQDDEIQLISSETGFTPTQIETLYSRFTSLDKEAVGSLSREDFLRVPEFAINPLCNRIVEMFFADLTELAGTDNHDRINFRQFAKVLATFRRSSSTSNNNNSTNNSIIGQFNSSSRNNKLYFMFRLYDMDNDNMISFDDLKSILKQMVGNYIDEAQTNKIVARAFMEVDKDGDNHINFDEFCQVFEGNDIDEKMGIKFSH